MLVCWRLMRSTRQNSACSPLSRPKKRTDLSGEFVADVLLVREDDGEGIVSLTLTVFGDLIVEDQVSLGETSPVLSVEQLPDDST